MGLNCSQPSRTTCPGTHTHFAFPAAAVCAPYHLPIPISTVSGPRPSNPSTYLSLQLPFPQSPARPASHLTDPASSPAPSVSRSPVGPGRHAAEGGGRPETAVGPAPRAAGIARLLTRAQLQRVLEGAEHAGRQPPVELLQELLGPVRAAPRRPPAAPRGARPARQQHQRQQHASGQRPDLRDRPLRAAPAPEDGRRAHRGPRAPRPCPAPRAPRSAPGPAPRPSRPSRPSRPTSSRTRSPQRGHVRRARVRVPAGLLRRGLRVPVRQRSLRHGHLSPTAPHARGPYLDLARAGSRWLLLGVRRASPRDEPDMGSLPPVAHTHQCPHVPGDAVGIGAPSRCQDRGPGLGQGSRRGRGRRWRRPRRRVCGSEGPTLPVRGTDCAQAEETSLATKAHQDRYRPPGKSRPSILEGFSSAG